DLWEAGSASKDPVIRRALREAYDNVTGLQERYAQEQGFGPAYRSAKRQYFQFKHELGGGLMSDFLNASQVEDQAMLPRVAQLISPANGEALRGLLGNMGVDVSPMADLIAEQKSVAEGAKQTAKDLSKQGTAILKTINDQTQSKLNEIGS